MTYPQITQLSTHVGLHYDALFSTWRLAWVAHQLLNDPVHLFDANIFYPEPNTLAYSDAMLFTALVTAPLMWAGVSPLMAYNLSVLASFATAGIAAYFLARSLGASQLGAWFGGVVFAFQPYRFAHYPQLELLWTCWIPLAFWALHRSIETRGVKYGVWLGIFVALQALSCLYYALFLVLALCLMAPLDAIPALRRRIIEMWKPAAASVAVAALLIAPYILRYLESSATVGMRLPEEVERWSPTLWHYTIAQFGNWIYPSPPNEVDPFEHVLFPGIVPVLAAIVAVVWIRSRRVFGYAVLLLLAVELSLGFNGSLYPWLYELAWPFRGLRVPARFFVMVSLALAVLGALGVTRLAATRLRRPLAAATIVAALIEVGSAPLFLSEVRPISKVYSWLAQQPPAPVLEWPTPMPNNLGRTDDASYMYHSTAHWFPLVNGYSGNYSESYIEFLHHMAEFPRQRALDHIARRGVRYLILHSAQDEHRYSEVVQDLTGNPKVRFQFSEDLGFEEIAIYVVDR